MDLRDTGRERCFFEEALLIDLFAHDLDRFRISSIVLDSPLPEKISDSFSALQFFHDFQYFAHLIKGGLKLSFGLYHRSI